ncbi:MAG: MBL fold metallo-hydrolase [Gemmatimonadota bacterium]
MIELAVLGSGSKGNSVLVRTGRTALLLDAGLSARQLAQRCHASDLDPRRLDGVLLTHEHSDHVRGLPVFARHCPVPVLGNAATLGAAGAALATAPRAWAFTTGVPFAWGDFTVAAFPVSHDAVEPVGFVLEAEGVRVGYATDLGRLTPPILAALGGCHIVVLEANHDVDMLWKGPYPWPLKQRISSHLGHLDNASGAGQLPTIVGGDTAHLVLAHLSENNNQPGLVRSLFAAALADAGCAHVQLTVAGQHHASPVLRV